MNNIATHSESVDRPASLSQSGAGWQQQLREQVTDADTLFDLLDLPRAWLPAARRATQLFALRVPRAFVARMQPGAIDDPLLRQVLPLADEHAVVAGFHADAVGDNASASSQGLLHKYHGRALIMATGACAVNCRYCFRRHFDYAGHNAARHRWRDVVDRIAADASIEEAIISGGDPLSLADNKLAALTDQLTAIGHVRRIRFHTRQPIVLPARIDDAFLRYFERINARCIVVIHCNHPNELDAATMRALERLHNTGALLLNQAVLLQGVNDDVDTLAALSERLFDAHVQPYYLHLLDRVAGTAHFEVGQPRAEQLMQSLAGRLPGFLVPKLARETPGAPAKRVIGYEFA